MTDFQEPELRGARGDGAEHFDDRAAFYLQNRALIEAWAGLRYDASQAAGRWLSSLADQVYSTHEQWPPWSGLAGKYRSLFLCPVPPLGDGLPEVAVGLAWNDSGVQPDKKGDSSSPFVGIRVNPDLSERVKAVLDEVDGGQPPGYQVASSWVRFRYVTAEAGWWEDLDTYRKRLLDEVSLLVQRYQAALTSFAASAIRE